MAKRSMAVKTISNEPATYSLRRGGPVDPAAPVASRVQTSLSKSKSVSQASTSRTVTTSPSRSVHPNSAVVSPPHRIIVSKTAPVKRKAGRPATRPNPITGQTFEEVDEKGGSSKSAAVPLVKNSEKGIAVEHPKTAKGKKSVKPIKRLLAKQGSAKIQEELVEESAELEDEEYEDEDEGGFRPPNRSKVPQYVVEKIVDKRLLDGKLEYKIRWSGYKPSDDSWTPVKDCNCTWAIQLFEKEFKGKVKKVKSGTEKQPRGAGKSSGRPMKRANEDGGAGSMKKKAKVQHDEDNGELWEETFTSPPDSDEPTTNMPPPLLIPQRKKPAAKKPKAAVGKGKNKTKNQKNNQKLRVQPIKPFTVPWAVLSEKTIKTIPKFYRDRLDKNEMPLKIGNSKNAPLKFTEEDGYQRYCCEWTDGMSCWIPGKLCCKIIPKLVISFGLHQLPVRENFIKTLMDSAFN